MTIYLTSDLHVDHYLNDRVGLQQFIDNALKPADVLCVAGDTSDNPSVFTDFYKAVSERYEKVFVVFGNHDLTIGNQTYFRNNPFRKTEDKIAFLKNELSKQRNVSILDGTVEEYKGIRFGGTMAFNDWTYGMQLDPDRGYEYFMGKWRYWFDYVNWNYKNQDHKAILKDEMTKLDAVIAGQPDIIMTHYIPLFFGVSREFQWDMTSTFFYFDGDKYLSGLKNNAIWLAGHTHSVRQRQLNLEGGRTIHLKINPVGYPDENSGNAMNMDQFLIER